MFIEFILQALSEPLHSVTPQKNTFNPRESLGKGSDAGREALSKTCGET
jgi:hypothetical protein